MKREQTLLCLLVLLYAVAGCSVMRPLPVIEPAAKDKNGNRTTPDYEKGGLFPATKLTEAVENLKIYGDAYQAQADNLRSSDYMASDATFFGGVLGVIGGLASSPGTALAGGLTAAGGSLASQRYQYFVQAQNYEKASEAMYCMYRNLYPNQSLSIPSSFVNETIDEVRRKLRKNQAAVQLVSPNMAELEASLKKVIEQKKEKENAQIAMRRTAAGTPAFTVASQQLNNAETEVIKSEVTKCAAAF